MSLNFASPTLLRWGAILELALGVSFAWAGDWPHWRGPDRNGTSKETGWLDQWPADGPAVAWRAKVGLGLSSFAVAGGSVFTMGHGEGKDSVFGFAAGDGKELWKYSYPAELGDKFFDGGTTGTPTVDGERVYTLSRWGDVYCFEAAGGKVVWSKHLAQETGLRIPGWGFGGSPLVHDRLLVLNVGDAGLALDKLTGVLIWQSANKDAGYSTPLPLKDGADTVAVFGSGQSYVAVRLRDGHEAWRLRWLTEYGVNATDPIADQDHLFLSTGYGKGAGLFRTGASQPELLWKSKVLRTQFNSAVLLQGYLYGVDGDTTESATLKCVELATGTEKWSQEGFGSGGLIAVDGKLVALSGGGELMVAPASPDAFRPTARAQVLGGKCWTAPVLANARIFCRNSRGDIVCLDVHKR